MSESAPLPDPGRPPPMPRIDSVDCSLPSSSDEQPPDPPGARDGKARVVPEASDHLVSSEGLTSRASRGWVSRRSTPIPKNVNAAPTLDPSKSTSEPNVLGGQESDTPVSRNGRGANARPGSDSAALRLPVVSQGAPSKPSEALLEGFQDLLQQHREDLGSYIDARLQQHHETLFKQLLEKGTRASMFISPAILAAAGGSEKDNKEGGRKTTTGRNSHQSGTTSGTQESGPPALDIGKCSFEEHEKMRMQMSRRARSRSLKTFSNSSSREIASEMRACFVRTEWRRCILACIEAPFFEGLVCLLIVSNVIFLGFEVESLWGIGAQDVPLGFDLAEYFFTTCFTIEFAMKLLAYGVWGTFCNKPPTAGPVVIERNIQYYLLREPKFWNVLDFVLVSSSWIEVAMEFSQRASPKLQYVRIIRLLRTTRIIRLVKIMKFFRPLRILVYSLANTLRSLMWVLFLLALIIYLFAVLFTVAASNYVSSRTSYDSDGLLVEFFGSLYSSTSSLFGAITGGLDWHVCVEALRPLHPIWTGLLISYIAVANFGILNVVTGVVCQTAMESAHQDHDIVVQAQLHLKQRYSEQLKSLFGVLANGPDEKITLHEFEERLRDKELKDYFVAMDLTIDEAWNLFKLLDNGDKAEIDVNTFVEGCLRLRGNARSIDVHMLMYQSKWTMKKLSSITSSIEEMQTTLSGHNQVLHALTGEDPLSGSEVRFAQHPSGSTLGGVLSGPHDSSSHKSA